MWKPRKLLEPHWLGTNRLFVLEAVQSLSCHWNSVVFLFPDLILTATCHKARTYPEFSLIDFWISSQKCSQLPSSALVFWDLHYKPSRSLQLLQNWAMIPSSHAPVPLCKSIPCCLLPSSWMQCPHPTHTQGSNSLVKQSLAHGCFYTPLLMLL